MLIPLEVKLECVRRSEYQTARLIYESYYQKVYPDANTFEAFRKALRRWKKNENFYLEKGDMGFVPHGTTVQMDGNGNIKQLWVKSKDQFDIKEFMEHIQNLPAINTMKPEPKGREKFMLEIPFFDMHFGVSDFTHYKQTLEDTLDIILRRHYDKITIIIGQDLLHNDDFRGRTSRGTPIEKVDMIQAWEDARRFYYSIIDLSILHANEVNVIYSKGNHDESMSWAFIQMIKVQYPGINVDDSLKKRKALTYGKNFLGFCHEMKGTAKDVALKFSADFPMEYGRSKTRAIHMGHLHTKKVENVPGCIVEVIGTSNKTDDWHDENDYIGSFKRMTLFLWSREKQIGEYYV